MKALTSRGWGKQKEILMATYKAVTRQVLEYASTIWSPLASSTSINKLQVMQNVTLRTDTGYTEYTNIQHYHQQRPLHNKPIPQIPQSPFLNSYLNKVDAKSHPSPLCSYKTPTPTTHIISSTVLTYAPHCHPGFVDRPRRSDGTDGQMDGESGW